MEFEAAQGSQKKVDALRQRVEEYLKDAFKNNDEDSSDSEQNSGSNNSSSSEDEESDWKPF